ncbi:MAG: MBL fold metallo-hydrolase [Duodenibacillus sp.]|nr:MBL fold metallo-hydrolase [Duodenibacillus sp.]
MRCPDSPERRRLLMGGGALALLAGAGLAGGCALGEAFGGKPSGARLARMLASPNYVGGAFVNREPAAELFTAKRSRLRNMLAFLAEDETGQSPGRPVPSVRTDLGALPEDRIVWLGHSGYCLRRAGLTILVDPALSQAFPLPGFFKPFAGADAYQPGDLPAADVLLITHDHYDHLDERTVKAIRSRVGRVICPLGVGAHFERWGYGPGVITELDWEETAAVKPGCAVTALPAQHFSGRGLRRNATLWAAFMLELDGFTAFFSGDGGYGSHFRRIGERWPAIDLAVLEDGQYNEAWSGIHLMPQDWKRAAADLHARVTMPCHNSKFDLSRHLWTDPLEAAADAAEELGLAVRMPLIGEPVALGAPAPAVVRWWRAAQRAG